MQNEAVNETKGKMQNEAVNEDEIIISRFDYRKEVNEKNLDEYIKQKNGLKNDSVYVIFHYSYDFNATLFYFTTQWCKKTFSFTDFKSNSEKKEEKICYDTDAPFHEAIFDSIQSNVSTILKLKKIIIEKSRKLK